MASLKLEAIRKSFGTSEVIKGVDLDIRDGEFLVFVGPSGCGKSTMLRLIAGLETPTSGTVSLDGSDITSTPPAGRGIAMVFQSYALFPHMTVAENIGFGLSISKVDKKTIARRVEEVASILQISDLLERVPRELSGGQRQRVAIGRAIIRNPGVFLFDEPLSNLDAALRVRMRLEIARLHKRLAATMIHVTHDQTEAMTLADRIALFRDGRIEQTGTPMELYHRPANRFVAGFIGAPAMNFLSLDRLPDAIVRNLEPLHAGRIAEIGIRPEHLALCDPDAGDLAGEIEIVETLGAETFAYVRIHASEDPLTVRVDGSITPESGTTTGISIERQRLHGFDSEGRRLEFR